MPLLFFKLFLVKEISKIKDLFIPKREICILLIILKIIRLIKYTYTAIITIKKNS